VELLTGAHLGYSDHSTVIGGIRYAPYGDFRGGGVAEDITFGLMECGVLVKPEDDSHPRWLCKKRTDGATIFPTGIVPRQACRGNIQ
jgi:hypothetical protein